MNKSYCNVVFKKRFIKCISKSDDKCYVFIGDNDNILTGIQKIEENYRNNLSNYYNNIEEKYIHKIYSYLTSIDEDMIEDPILDQKLYITKELYLDEYNDKKDSLIFIRKESILDDDINQDVINKICCNCYDDITFTFIYAWYHDLDDKLLPLTYKYENDNINYLDIYGGDIEDVIDTSFIDNTGEKMSQMMTSNTLTLFDNNLIKDNVIYFISLEEYLEKTNKKDEIINIQQNGLEINYELNRFINGVLLKYWPKCSKYDVLNYYVQESIDVRKENYEKMKNRIKMYSNQIKRIENPFFREKMNTKVSCYYDLLILKLDSLSEEINTIHLSKIFNEFTLTSSIPFMKLMLNNHNETYFKMNESCLSYEGEEKTSERFISKSMSESWSEGYNIKTDYGFKYLHTDNIIMFKIFTYDKDLYSTLIIHYNGDVECIIEKNLESLDPNVIITGERISEMIKNCNDLLQLINENRYWSFSEIKNTLNNEILSDDLYTSKKSSTKIDFMNSVITFNKEEFEFRKVYFPFWNVFLNNFMINFPSFFRIRTKEEIEIDEEKIFSRYKRVNNFASLSTIHSAIAMYSILYEDKEDIIYHVAKDYNQEQDFISLEYDAWMSLVSAKDDFDDKRKRPIQETGAEVIIYQDEKDNLKINIHNIRSIDEENRILFFMKTMMGMYQSYINKTPFGNNYSELFTNINYQEVSEFKTEDEEKDFDVEEFLGDDDNEDFDVENFLDEDDDDDDEDDFDFDALGGGGNSSNPEKLYDVKSYYLKRLKKYDQNLFKFKSRKLQPNGMPYGYPKLCTVSPSLGDRQPVAVTSDELKRINESYDEGSGRDSYSVALSVPRRGHVDVKYICPKYWDVSKGLSIDPDNIKAGDKNIVPAKLPKGANGKSKQTILERSGTYWKNAEDDISKYVPEIREESKQLHPDGFGLPCCLNSKKKIKENDYVSWYVKNEMFIGKVLSIDNDTSIVSVEQSDTKEKHNIPFNKCRKPRLEELKESQKQSAIQKEKNESDEIDPKDRYISNKDPERKGKYGHIHEFLMKYFHQSSDDFNKREGYGFLRLGVDQNDSKFIFNRSAFIQSYIKILEDYFHNAGKHQTEIATNEFIKLFLRLKIERNENDGEISENDFIHLLSEYLIHNIDLFQKCILVKYFHKPKEKIKPDDIELLKQTLQNIKDKNTYNKSVVNGLLKDLNDGKIYFTSTDKTYLFNLLFSIFNFIDYLRSDENKEDKYILPILNLITKINIVIFENIDGEEIKIRSNDYFNTGKYGYIYKNGTYYEPMLYRTLNDEYNKKVDSFLLTRDLMNNNHYEVIIDGIDEKIKKNSKNLELEEYRKIIYKNGYKVNAYYVNNYSEIQYIICSKSKKEEMVDTKTCILFPIRPQLIPVINTTKLIYKIPEYSISELKETIDSLELFDKDNHDLKIIKLLKDESGFITTIVLNNSTYVPVEKSKEIPQKYKRLVEEDINLHVLENLITQDLLLQNDATLFIEYNSYEKYIRKLAFQHILHKIDTIEPEDGFTAYIQNKDGFSIGEKIHFTYQRYDTDDGPIDLIIKLDENEIFNSPLGSIYDEDFKYNYSIDGTIQDIYKSDKKNKSFPDLMNVNIKVEFIDRLKKILKDDIMITLDKKKALYSLLQPHLEELFYPLTDDIYEENMLKRYITLCNYNKDSCEYPCFSDDQKCKLYIKERDNNDNLLIEKLIYNFIEKLLIYGIDNRLQIVDEHIDINDIRNSIQLNEVFYTYIEYKRDHILESIYEKHSKYINDYGKMLTSIRKTNVPYKKLDMIPYFITKLFGQDSNVLVNLSKDNNDLLVFSKSLNEIGINYTIQEIKDIIIHELDNYDKHKLLNQYEMCGKEYKTIDQIKHNISHSDNYELDYPDIEMFLKYIGRSDDNIKCGVIIISQKYNSEKKNTYRFIKSSDEIDETTPIISFFHVKLGEYYILSNIISQDRYGVTVKELHKKEDYHKKMIEIK